MKLDFYWQQYKYFPYEKNIAAIELEELFNDKPKKTTFGYSINSKTTEWKKFANYTTYFQKVISENGEKEIPLQTKLELSANVTISSFKKRTIFQC